VDPEYSLDVISGHVHQSPFMPRLLVRSARQHLGVQRRPSTRPPPVHIVSISVTHRLLAAARSEQYIDLNAPLQRPAAAITHPPEWPHILGRIADPSLARSLIGGG